MDKRKTGKQLFLEALGEPLDLVLGDEIAAETEIIEGLGEVAYDEVEEEKE